MDWQPQAPHLRLSQARARRPCFRKSLRKDVPAVANDRAADADQLCKTGVLHCTPSKPSLAYCSCLHSWLIPCKRRQLGLSYYALLRAHEVNYSQPNTHLQLCIYLYQDSPAAVNKPYPSASFCTANGPIKGRPTQKGRQMGMGWATGMPSICAGSAGL